MRVRLVIVCLFVALIYDADADEVDWQIKDSTVVEVSGDSTTVDVTQDSIKKKGFFNKIYRYFADSNEDKTTTKKLDFSIIGGPHYSSDTKLGLGLVAAGLYRVDRNDMSIPPSNVSIYGDISTTGFYLLGVRGNTLLKGAKYRVDYTTYFFSFPSQFWGIGYENGLNAESSSYKRQQAQFKVDVLFRLIPKLYVGVSGGYYYIKGHNFSNMSYLEGQKPKSSSGAIGVSMNYDTRDFITNAHRGMFVKLEQLFFPSFMNNIGSFNRTELFFSYYHPIWKGGVMAYDFHTMLNNGDTPWTMLALMGGSNRMRGYYEGKYRDKNLMEVTAELRQKVYGRSGVAVWVGAGNVFRSFKSFEFKQTLPNYGIGYRWEFKKRVNVRLDYGFGKKQSGFIFNISEAF